MKRALVALAAALVLVVGSNIAHAAGETITVEDSTAWGSLDPQAQQLIRTAQIHFVTCEGLYAYPDASGTAGMGAQPDVAAGPPTLTNGGLTYTFTVRSGFEFSSGEAVTAQSFADAVQRLQGPVGVSSGNAALAADIASSGASGDQLTITFAHLPTTSILTRLAHPQFCPVPSDAPPTSIAPDTMASDGPYYVSDASGGAWTLSQNPHYGGSRIRNLGTIVWKYGVSPSTAVADTLAGTADYAPSVQPTASLATDYGAGSPADAAGHQQYYVDPSTLVGTVVFNVRPGHPLADEQTRQAVACAIDRAALASQVGGLTATPFDHFILPGFPGSANQSLCPITTTPLPSGLVLNGFFRPNGLQGPTAASLLQSQLASVGVTLNNSFATSTTTFFNQMPGTPSNWDVTLVGWVTDDSDPNASLSPLFSTGGATNWPGFSDPTIDADLANAEALPLGSARDSAFANVDHEIAVAAPMAAAYTAGRADLFSPRIGCQVYQPLFGMNLNLLCVRVADTSVPAGGTVSTGTAATTLAPLQTAVTTPTGGTVQIQQGVTTATTSGYTLLAQQLQISAPSATTADPLRLAFTLDASAIGSADPSTVDVFRDGAVIPNCNTYPGSTTAAPDPCVTSRTPLAGGDLEIVVLSSHASRWNFAILPPAQLTAAVRDRIGRIGLPAGIATSLAAKLQPATCSSLKALAHEISAQAGKKIPPAAAQELLADVAQLRAELTC